MTSYIKTDLKGFFMLKIAQMGHKELYEMEYILCMWEAPDLI